MRVLHVAETVTGGVGSHIEEVVAFQGALLGRDAVRVVAPADPAGAPPGPFVGRGAGEVARFARARRSPASLAALAASTLRVLRDFRPDVLHLHSTFAGAVIRPLVVLARPRPLVVYCPHGWAFGMDAGARRQALYAAVERRLGARTDLVLLNSESERRLAERYRVAARRMEVVPNGVAERPGAAPGEGEPPRTGPLRLAFVGRLDRQKGLDLLLPALAAAGRADLELHVIGAGVVGDAGLGPMPAHVPVVMHGWRPRDEVFSLLRGMDALVMPSRWEAAPLALLEAMQCGLPAIVSDRGGMPEVVRDGIDGHVVPLEDPARLTRILGGLSREGLVPMGRAARARFLAEFTAERMNRRLMAAYAGAGAS